MKSIIILLLLCSTCYAKDIMTAELGQEASVLTFPDEGRAVWCAWKDKIEVIRLDDRSVWIKCVGNTVNDKYEPPKKEGE